MKVTHNKNDSSGISEEPSTSKDIIDHDAKKSQRFQCNDCPKDFSRKATLLQHQRDIHEHLTKPVDLERALHEKVRPFICDICGFAFKRKAHLKGHKEAKHETHLPHLVILN